MRQILDPHGELVDVAPDLSEEQLVEIHRDLLTARIVDEKLLSLQRQGRLPAYYQSSGQEAAVGAAMALRPTDWIFTAYRELPFWIARDMPLKTAAGFWLGIPDDDDIWDVHRLPHHPPQRHHRHPPAARGRFRVRRAGCAATTPSTMVIFGDGATSESDFHAAMNFAGVWKTPTVFLCQNNQVAQSTTVDRQTAAGDARRQGAGVRLPRRAGRRHGPARHVRGDSPRRRAERAPATARPSSRCTPTGMRRTPPTTARPVYRTDDEEAAWRAKDPIVRMRTFLEHKGLWQAADEERMRDELSAELEALIDELEARPGVARDYSPRHLFDRMPRPAARPAPSRTGRPGRAAHRTRTERDLGGRAPSRSPPARPLASTSPRRST